MNQIEGIAEINKLLIGQFLGCWALLPFDWFDPCNTMVLLAEQSPHLAVLSFKKYFHAWVIHKKNLDTLNVIKHVERDKNKDKRVIDVIDKWFNKKKDGKREKCYMSVENE